MVQSNEQIIVKERERERSRFGPSYGPTSLKHQTVAVQSLAPHISTPHIYTSPASQVESHGMIQYGGLTLPQTSSSLSHPLPPPLPLIPLSQKSSYPPPTVPASYPPINPTYSQLQLGPPQAWVNPYHSEVIYDQPATPDFSQSFSSARCSAHGKIRTIQNLKKNEKGEWSCVSGSECRTLPSLGNWMCSIHNKKRSLQNLVKDGNGKWVCDSRSTCITMSKSVFAKEICSVHGKLRSLRYLAQRTPGVYACLVDSECYVTKHPNNVRQQPVPLGNSLH